jgi:transporter family-2 protein
MEGIIIAIIAGALMSIQGVFNTRLTETSSIWVANAFVQFTGLIVCIIMWFVTGMGSFSLIFEVESKLYLLGGVIGAIIIYGVIKAMSSLGPACAVMLILIAQLLVAYGIELFGLFGTEQVGFEIRKLIGILIMIGGIVVFKCK